MFQEDEVLRINDELIVFVEEEVGIKHSLPGPRKADETLVVAWCDLMSHGMTRTLQRAVVRRTKQ